MRGRAITEKPLISNAQQSVANILLAADVADSIKIVINVDKTSVPTISYEVNGLPLVAHPPVEAEDEA